MQPVFGSDPSLFLKEPSLPKKKGIYSEKCARNWKSTFVLGECSFKYTVDDGEEGCTFETKQYFESKCGLICRKTTKQKTASNFWTIDPYSETLKIDDTVSKVEVAIIDKTTKTLKMSISNGMSCEESDKYTYHLSRQTSAHSKIK